MAVAVMVMSEPEKSGCGGITCVCFGDDGFLEALIAYVRSRETKKEEPYPEAKKKKKWWKKGRETETEKEPWGWTLDSTEAPKKKKWWKKKGRKTETDEEPWGWAIGNAYAAERKKSKKKKGLMSRCCYKNYDSS